MKNEEIKVGDVVKRSAGSRTRKEEAMKNEEIKVGDVVKLKSGGPAMTVSAEQGDMGNVRECQWFSGIINGGILQVGCFRLETLAKCDQTLPPA